MPHGPLPPLLAGFISNYKLGSLGDSTRYLYLGGLYNKSCLSVNYHTWKQRLRLSLCQGHKKALKLPKNRITLHHSYFLTCLGSHIPSLMPLVIEGCTWCTHKCFDCGEIIKAESKTKFKLAFHNHICSDNYGDDELLPGICSIEDVVVDHVYRSSSSPPLYVSGEALSKASKQEQATDLDLTPKAKTAGVIVETLPLTCKHVLCMPGNYVKLK